MVGRGEPTDVAWEQIEPLLPENGRKGGRWRDHRTVIDGILWKLRTGAPWRDLAERYGPWQTCFGRFNRWRRDGTWDRLLEHAQTKSDAVGEVEALATHPLRSHLVRRPDNAAVEGGSPEASGEAEYAEISMVHGLPPGSVLDTLSSSEHLPGPSVEPSV
jgi:transposase